MASTHSRAPLGVLSVNKPIDLSSNAQAGKFDRAKNLDGKPNVPQTCVYNGLSSTQIPGGIATSFGARLGFLDLPREIRDSIYVHYVFNKCSCCNDEEAVTVANSHPPHISLEQVEPSLSRTCRLVRAELLPIFYANTNFDFVIEHWHILCVLIAWREMISDEQAYSVRRIVFTLNGNVGWRNAARFLKTMEERFSPECVYHFSGESAKMCSAYQRTCEIGKRLRDHGVGWKEVEEDLSRVGHCIEASGWDGSWSTEWSDHEDEAENDSEADGSEFGGHTGLGGADEA